MSFESLKYKELQAELSPQNITMVAVTKMKPVEDIMEAYNNGLMDFGENYVQELLSKQAILPQEIRWHFIGHLQSNKVKLIIPFVYLIHGVDSEKLLSEINRQAEKAGRTVRCLLQVHISDEETKFGFSFSELESIDPGLYKHVEIAGLMGIGSFSNDEKRVRSEFRELKMVFDKLSNRDDSFKILSMGMSADYKLAIEEGSTMVRIGSLLFGERKKRDED